MLQTHTEVSKNKKNTKTSAASNSLFAFETWEAKLPELKKQYKTAKPYAHIMLPHFLAEPLAQQLVDEFPKTTDASWTHYKHFNENKLGKTNRAEFPETIGKVIDEFQSPRFVKWLSDLTGIANLEADPSLEGGGMHQTQPGGFLNMHTDFTMHHYHPNWRRRVNLLLYLNPGWQDSWGGHLELWDKQVKKCEAKYPPLFNHAVVFTTTDESYHGHPEPLKSPDGINRRSIALYYFTHEENKDYFRSTVYQPRPSDSIVKKALIFVDTKAVDVYSKIKTRFKLSDRFASDLLKIFFRKK